MIIKFQEFGESLGTRILVNSINKKVILKVLNDRAKQQ